MKVNDAAIAPLTVNSRRFCAALGRLEASAEARAHFRFIGGVFHTDSPASRGRTPTQLGWMPAQKGCLPPGGWGAFG